MPNLGRRLGVLCLAATAALLVGVMLAETVTDSVKPGQTHRVDGRDGEVKAVAPGTVWNQWRGPQRDGHLGVGQLPADLKGLARVWHIDLSEGYSGPIVAGGRVITFETKDNREEVVRAIDLNTGKEAWKAAWEGSMRVPFFAAKNGSWVRSTPATDGVRVFVGGMRDVLVCLDAATGKELWRVDFVASLQTPLPAFGLVCSPLVDGKHVYIQAGAGVVKLEAATGKIVWRGAKDGGGMWGSAFSSPVMANIDGRRQLLVQTRTHLIGVDIETGATLWKQPVPNFRGMNILTPVALKNRVFTSTYGKGTFAFDIARDGDAWKVSQAWTERTQGYMSTPLLIGRHVYLQCRNRRYVCFDLASGELKWKSKERFGEYASLVTDGRRILALDARGELLLIAADPTRFHLIDRKAVSKASTWAHLAVTSSGLLVRDLKGLALWHDGGGEASKVGKGAGK